MFRMTTEVEKQNKKKTNKSKNHAEDEFDSKVIEENVAKAQVDTEVKTKKPRKRNKKRQLADENVIDDVKPDELPKKKRKRNRKKSKNPEAITDGENQDNSGKKKKRQKDPNHFHESVARKKALTYLDTWANRRAEWKFEKCRQIWLMNHCYDPVQIPDGKFDDLLQYAASIQGRMRDVVLDVAQKHLHLSEQWETLMKEGKTDADILEIVGKPKPLDATLNRAKDISEMLK